MTLLSPSDLKEIKERHEQTQGMASSTLPGPIASDVLSLAHYDRSRLLEYVEGIQRVVDEQAKDEGLWFQPVYISEDILQRALRRLHEVIDGKSQVECALDILSPQTGAQP